MGNEAWDGKKSLWKGLVAGIVAGVVATAAMSVAENLYPRRVRDRPESLTRDEFAHSLEEPNAANSSEALQWGFGTAAGAFYGALAEFYPAATSNEGAGFGLALMSLIHQKALSDSSSNVEPEPQNTRERTSEAATHILYGVVAEFVRGVVRGLLD